MECNVCHTVVDETTLFCSHCGTQMIATHDIECETHAGVAANVVCVICGMPLCNNCSDVQNGIHFCKSKHHKIYNDEYALLVRTPTQFSAEMIVKNLELKGVHVVSYTARQFANSQSLRDTTLTRIYVRRETSDTAKNILQELDIMDFTDGK